MGLWGGRGLNPRPRDYERGRATWWRADWDWTTLWTVLKTSDALLAAGTGVRTFCGHRPTRREGARGLDCSHLADQRPLPCQ